MPSNKRNVHQFNVNEISLDVIDAEIREFNETFWSNFNVKAQKIELKMKWDTNLRCGVEGIIENVVEVADVDIGNGHIHCDNSDDSNHAHEPFCGETNIDGRQKYLMIRLK